ncbi:MAG: flagellar hook-basal body complex protein FliE [Pseudomonadota bacterium]
MMTTISPLSGSDPTRPVAGAAAAASPSFGDTFATVAANTRDALKAGEAAAISGLSGENSVQDVVQALMGAEQQLRAAIAVRDRVVAAYQEISRMQI